MKKLINLITLVLCFMYGVAQNTDTTAGAKSDTLSPKKTTKLSEVGVTAKKPVYMTDGEKTLYNVSEDPAVQTGTAADALQNAPGVEVSTASRASTSTTSTSRSSCAR